MKELDHPLVSVAMCTYNGEKFLSQQLDSLVKQTYPNIEIIVVDDASTDKTSEILLDYASKFPNIKVFTNHQNLGYVKNFEKVLQITRGDLIALCDQDDIWDLHKIEIQVDSIGTNMLSYHDSEFIWENGELMNKKMSDVVNMYSGSEPAAFLFFNCVSGHSILMKRELLNDIFPLNPTYFHDWQIAYKAANAGTINYINKPLVFYRQHQKSDTNILKLKRKQAANLKNHNSFTNLKKEMAWLKECASYPKNKNPELVITIYQYMVSRLENYTALNLVKLLWQNVDILFFIQKKSRTSKLNFIAKLFWGLKTKSLWDHYFKPKQALKSF